MIPKDLREGFGLEKGDEVRWEKAEDGIRIGKATRTIGRRMLVDDDVLKEKREEIEAEIRKKWTEWQP